MNRRSVLFLFSGAALLGTATWALADRLEDTWYVALDHPAIQYAERAPEDAVAKLDQRLESGKLKLAYAPNGWGYVPALLKEFGINVDSQVLVFSKTSIQANHINPAAPRAIYFNDEVTVGLVQGGEVVEMTALDPRQGVKMYAMPAERADKPEIARRDECLQCHQGPITLGIPGMLVSSVHPASDMTRDMHGSAFMTDHRTEFKDRWGGWYVTGTHGAQTHLGNNKELIDPVHPGDKRLGPQNVTSLGDMLNTARYPAATSDLVALLVLEHQVRMTNLIVRIGWDTRIAAHDGTLDKAVRATIDEEIEELVGYMLFVDEAPLAEPVAGVSSFTKTFPARGPRDKQGRSLRDFDLKTRLFKYPLSYMIYTAAFDALPDDARNRIYQRLYDVLSGKEQGKVYAGLSAADRGAILGILRETKPNLPGYWKIAGN